MKFQSRFIQALSMGLIIMWAYAATTKLMEAHVFYDQLRAYPFIGKYAGFFSIAFPIVMLIAATLLTITSLRNLALSFSFGLLSVITFFIMYVITLSPVKPCSCNGIWPSTNWWVHISINGVVMVLTAVALYQSKYHKVINEDGHSKSALSV